MSPCSSSCMLCSLFKPHQSLMRSSVMRSSYSGSNNLNILRLSLHPRRLSEQIMNCPKKLLPAGKSHRTCHLMIRIRRQLSISDGSLTTGDQLSRGVIAVLTEQDTQGLEWRVRKFKECLALEPGTRARTVSGGRAEDQASIGHSAYRKMLQQR